MAAEASIKAIFTILNHILSWVKIQFDSFGAYIPEFLFFGWYNFEFRSDRWVNNGYHSRDRPLMIENSDLLTILYVAQVFTQVRLKFRDCRG